MTGAADQVPLPNEIVRSVKLLVGIANPFKTQKVNLINPNIQPIIVYFNHVIVTGNSDRYYLPLSSFDSGTNVPRSRRNIYNCT